MTYERVKSRLRTLGSRIKKARKSKAISQEKLGYTIGVSMRTIQNIEDGKPTSIEKYLKIQQELNIDDLFIWHHKKNQRN